MLVYSLYLKYPQLIPTPFIMLFIQI